MPSGDEDVTPSLESSTSETNEQQVPVSQDTDQGATPDSSPDTQPTPPVGSDASSATTDPVQDAIARLAKPEPGAKPEAKDAKPNADRAEQEKPATDAPTDGKQAEKPAKPKVGPTLENPFEGWLTEQQQQLLKPHTRERITDLHARWKAAESHPERVLGTEFKQMLDQHKLSDEIGFVPPDHLAGLVKVQAAVNRSLLAMEQGRRPSGADLQSFQGFLANVDQLKSKFGLTSHSIDAIPAPLEGQLSSEYQDLIDVYQLPEKRVRMLAALEKLGNKAPASARSTAAPQASQPPVSNVPEGPDMEALHARRAAGAMATSGIPADRMAAHQKILEPVMQDIVRRTFPGVRPEQVIPVFNALSAKERVDIFLQAHAEHQAGLTAPAPSKKPMQLAPTTRPALTGGAPRRAAQAPSSDPVVNAIRLLSRDE